MHGTSLKTGLYGMGLGVGSKKISGVSLIDGRVLGQDEAANRSPSTVVLVERLPGRRRGDAGVEKTRGRLRDPTGSIDPEWNPASRDAIEDLQEI